MAGSSFNYDAFGRRTVKTEPTIIGGTTTKNYGWAGWSQVSGNQAPVVSSSLDSPIRLERGTDNSVRVPVQDSHGNVTKVINPTSGGMLFTASYSPFGERNITYAGIAGSDGKGQPLGFTGAEHDAVSELVYMRNRYYAPGLGRFISEDPIGFDGGENFYAYCGNDPINFSDPLGLYSVGDGFATGFAAVADGGVAAFSGIADPNVWMNMLHPGLPGAIPDAYNPGAMLRKWYKEYSSPTYGSYRCMEGYGVSAVLAEFGAGVIFSEIGGRAASAAGSSPAWAAIKRLLGINCFPAGTLIQLADGTVKPIEEVTDKDLVWARDDVTGETKACHVKQTFHKSADELVVLSFGEVGDTSGKIVETIRCTVEHPFFVDGKGWVGAKDLGIGTKIVTRAGPNLVVRKVEREKHSGGIGIYNFEVEGLHSYFVGTHDGGLWVHNTSSLGGLGISRVRHHTSVGNMNGIISDGGKIQAGRRGAVFVEAEPFGPVSGPNGPNRRFVAQEGAYIEFDVASSDLFPDNVLTGAPNSFGILGEVDLAGRNAKYVTVNWWVIIKSWFGR